MSHDLLPDDLWQLIGFKLDSVLDRIRFRAVSKTWNSLLPARLPPWLVLSGEGENQETDQQARAPLTPPPRRGFVSLGEDRVYEFDCPELHQSRMIGSSGNWLITVHTDTSLRLFNPFSKRVMPLPPSLSLDIRKAYTDRPDLHPTIYRDVFMSKLVLSTPPSESQGQHDDFIAVVIHDYRNVLAFTRPGDESWTPFETPHPKLWRLNIEDVIYYKQRFYAVDRLGKLIVCDLGDDSSPPKLWYINNGVEFEHRFPALYLVEWVGELLLVIRIVENLEDPDDYKTRGFELYKLDSENQWNELRSLGEHSLFLGFNTSVALLASDYYGLMKKNCIYFTDNYAYGYRGNGIPGGRDMGVYDLEDGTITPHFRGVSTSLFSPPVWISPP